MSTSNTKINQGDNSLAVVDNSKTKNFEKTVNVDKTITADTSKLEECQNAILNEVVKIGQQLEQILNKGAE